MFNLPLMPTVSPAVEAEHYGKTAPGATLNPSGRFSLGAVGSSASIALALIGLLLFAGCTAPRASFRADLSAPGWHVRQGQAVWHPGNGKPEIAGELVLAVRLPDEAFVQFSKTPFPIVSAQRDRNGWQIEFPQGRRFAGTRRPPARLIWLFLPFCIEAGAPPPRNWAVERVGPEQWRAERRHSSETLEVYLTP
ncbi:MAG: hypothetical protein U1G07_26800 [Verrucomicrobiota bacterium]